MLELSWVHVFFVDLFIFLGLSWEGSPRWLPVCLFNMPCCRMFIVVLFQSLVSICASVCVCLFVGRCPEFPVTSGPESFSLQWSRPHLRDNYMDLSASSGGLISGVAELQSMLDR